MARTFPTLRAYFVEAYRPHFLADARTATVAIYETTLAFWELFVPGLPLDQITNAWVGAFRTQLVARNLSPHTTNKYLRALNAMLGKAGPVGPRNRDALGLLSEAPWAKPVKTPATRPRAIPLGRLGLIYRACDVARVPKADGIDPTEWWRGIIVCASQIGLRRQALVNGITFAMVHVQSPSFLAGALLGIDRDDPDKAATLHLPASLDKVGVDRRKPINDCAFRRIRKLFQQRVRGLSDELLSDPDFEPAQLSIFPWTYKSRRMFDVQWHAIQDAAGIPPAEHYKFHDLKKTCGTQLGTVANAFAVKSFLDHASINTSEHYCDGGEQLREAVERMPHPVEFDGLGI